MANSMREFFQWTLREAIAKATGEGLSRALALHGAPLVAANGAPPAAITVDGQNWLLASRRLGAVCMAVAWQPLPRAADPLRRLVRAMEGVGRSATC